MNLRVFANVVEVSIHGSCGAVEAHRHAGAYAAIVLQGEYSEISADGNLVAGPGDVIVHPVFHSHVNVFPTSPVSVLNLRLPMEAGVDLPYARLRLDELSLSQDDITRYPRDSADAIAVAFGRWDHGAELRADEDELGVAWRRLKEPRAPRIRRVAADVGISAEHLARKFRARYGLSPVEYRSEHRFRHALRGLLGGDTAAATAFNCGYSDQSHLSRDIRLRIGMTPGQLLRSFELDK